MGGNEHNEQNILHRSLIALKRNTYYRALALIKILIIIIIKNAKCFGVKKKKEVKKIK